MGRAQLKRCTGADLRRKRGRKSTLPSSMALREAEIRATICRMVKSRRSANQKPDLFEATSSQAKQMKSHSVSPERTPSILPADLGSALRHLTDADLEKLATAVTAESERRNPPVATPASPNVRNRVSSSSKSKTTPSSRLPDPGPAPFTPAKLQAIRAALGAGIKPTVIARQFGVSQAAIREALTEMKKK